MRYLRGLLLAVWIGALCALPVLAQTHTIHLPLILHGAKAPQPSATPSGTATATATRTPTPTRTATATRTLTPTRTATRTATATFTRTPTVTHTATVTATRTATATATRTPTGTPVPPVEFLANHSAFLSVAQSLWVMGEVKNNTGFSLRVVKIAVDFYDGEHNLVDTANSYVRLNALPPGERTCFNVISMSPAATWQTYTFSATYRTDGVPLPPGLTIPSHSGQAKQYTYDIAGQVYNGTGQRVEFVDIIATVYDSTGRVGSCYGAEIDGSHLDAGQSSPFTLHVPIHSHNPLTSYRVQVDGEVK